MSKWHKRNKERLRSYNRAYWRDPVNNARQRANRLKIQLASPRYALGAALAHAVKRKPAPVPATVDDLMALWVAQDGCCALSGVLMTWRKGKVTPTSVSIDRIDHKRGYSADNVRLVCYTVNAFRGQMTDERMLDMARAIIAKAEVASKEPTWKPYLVHSEAM